MFEAARSGWLRRIASSGDFEYVKAAQLRDGDVIARMDVTPRYGNQVEDPDHIDGFYLTQRPKLEKRFRDGDTVVVRNVRAEQSRIKGTPNVLVDIDGVTFQLSARQGVVRAVG